MISPDEPSTSFGCSILTVGLPLRDPTAQEEMWPTSSLWSDGRGR